jgi:hypothetical protein
LRQQPLVRVTREIGFLLNVFGLRPVHRISDRLLGGPFWRKGVSVLRYESN